MNVSFGFMVNESMVLGTLVPLVRGSWGPVATSDPPQAHVHGFYALGYGGKVGDTNRRSVVGLQGRLGLRLSQFYYSVAQG